MGDVCSPGRSGGFRYDSDLQIRIDPHICNDSDLRIRIDPHICNDADLRIFTGFIKSQQSTNKYEPHRRSLFQSQMFSINYELQNGAHFKSTIKGTLQKNVTNVTWGGIMMHSRSEESVGIRMSP